MIKQKIVIVGAGIVGASMAYHLAKRNQDVTVIERYPEAAREVTENRLPGYIRHIGWLPITGICTMHLWKNIIRFSKSYPS
ncbi:FAD-dependent oxidoreductase [Paenibacillus taichungensis]